MNLPPSLIDRLLQLVIAVILLVAVILLAAIALAIFASPARAAQPAADAVVLAARDISRLQPDEAHSTRYLWVSDRDPKLRRQTWEAVAGHVNFLSLSQRIVSPPLVLADGQVLRWQDMKPNQWADLALIRINLRHYRQSAEQWDLLGDPRLEPIFHTWNYNADEKRWYKALAPWLIEPLGVPEQTPDRVRRMYQTALVELVKATGYAHVPIVEARNYVWQTSINFDRPAGYYTWLGIEDKATFDKLVGADFTRVRVRDAVAESGIAQQPRIVERFGKRDGYWRTLDQFKRGIGKRNPLNTDNLDPDDFLFDAQEVIANMSNGLNAYLLADKDGKRQDSAPDQIGYNRFTSSNNGRIEIYITCLDCHDKQPGRGNLQPFKPFFRNKYAEPGPVALGAREQAQLDLYRDLYLTPIDPKADLDRRGYAQALFEANGLEPHEYAASLSATFWSWERALDLDHAAAEHGLTEAEFVKGLQGSFVQWGTLNSVSSNWIVPAARRTKIGRDQFAEFYSQEELALRGLPQWAVETKAQLYPWKGVKK
jgi:hypothetical protein